MGRDEVVYEASAAPSRETVSSTVLPSSNVIVPVGVKPEPLVFVTLAVKVIDWPATTFWRLGAEDMMLTVSPLALPTAKRVASLIE